MFVRQAFNLRSRTAQRRFASTQKDPRQVAQAKFQAQFQLALARGTGKEVPAAAKKQETPLPVKLSGAAGAAAGNLWRNVYEADGLAGLERTQKELDVFLWSVEGKKAWTSLIYTPDVLIPREKKDALLLRQLEAIGASQTFIDNLTSIFHTKDIYRLEQIRDDFFTIVRAFKREVDVRIITPKAMDAATLEFMKSTVALNFLSPQDNMILATEVDPSIVSGYKVILKGMTHDFTSNKAIEAAAAKDQQKAAATISMINSYRSQLPPEFDSSAFAIWDEAAKDTSAVRVVDAAN